MNERTTSKGKVMRSALALLLIASTLLTSLLPAFASQASAAESVGLTIGSSNYYGGWSTTWMYADDNIAYCADPQSSTPNGGTYSKSGFSAPSGRTQEAAADLWFGYGSPGFDKSLWPSTWYDGSEMNSAHYAALAHILLSDTYTSDGSYALYGCSEDFSSWCRKNVIGYNSKGELVNDDATGRQIARKAGEVPSNFKPFVLHTGEGYQVILSFEYVPYGAIDLTKASANPTMSSANPCYDISGAEYTVYSKSNLTGKAGTITTDGNGYGKLGELEPGSYWVKEAKAAPGYALDEITYKVAVESEKTTHVNGNAGVVDLPQSDPVGMVVAKIDPETGEKAPEGDGTYAGAQFTVSYYAGLYDSAEAARASGDAVRTWVFETDSDGFAYLDPQYKVAGDELYQSSNGDYSIPLGTVVVTETKAPVGYMLDDGHGNAPKSYCVKIEANGAQTELITSYNTPESPDSVKRGDFRLVKEVPVTIYSEGLGDMPQEVKRVLVPGVQFQIINDSANAVVAPDGHKAAPGEVVCTIATDENGLATTKALDKPAEWDGALAYGSYVIHEVIPSDVNAAFKAEYGKDLIAVPDWKATISENSQYDAPQLVNNHIPQTPIKIAKVDAETGKQIPLPCSFQLMDANSKIVSYTSHYPEEQVIDTWTTNARGEVTLPMMLEEGAYTIVEVTAPDQYVLNLDGLRFEVGSVYNGWDNPIELTFEDMPQKGAITVAKTDSDTNEPVEGSTYIVKAAVDIITPEGTVRANADDIVATLVTDADGKAATQELYLGSYTVYEAKATNGFALDVVEKTVSLEYQGQEIAVFDEPCDVVDVPTEIKIHKVDSLDEGATVPGAKFHVWNDDGTYDEVIETDADGMLRIAYATHGTWHEQEAEAPEGYVINDVDDEGKALVHDFFVNDQGMIESEDGSMSATVDITISNMPKTMKTTAADENSGTHEGQAREDMTIVDTVEYTGCIPGNEYTVEGTLMDKATGEPALDADGSEITASATFTAEDFTGSIDLTFTFDGSTLAGKQFVAFETMTYEDSEYMVHADINDVDQTVNVVDIHTLASNPVTCDNLGTLGEEVTLVDTVSFEGLTVGNTYKLFTSLIDAESGQAIKAEDGTALVTKVEFVAESESETIDAEMAIDSSELAGKTLVFFESLADATDSIIAVHEDLDDEGQSIHFAAIRTNAVDASDGDKNIVAGEDAKITDTVTYKNLIPGKEYLLEGVLMDKDTGVSLKDAQGNEIKVEATFTPEEANGCRR